MSHEPRRYNIKMRVNKISKAKPMAYDEAYDLSYALGSDEVYGLCVSCTNYTLGAVCSECKRRQRKKGVDA
jgi:hypothetical protein